MLLNIKKMKKTLFVFLFAAAIVGLVSCGQSPESKLIGTWKAVDVQTDFDESAVNPEMLAQMVEVSKSTYFRIMNDSVMIIINDENTYETKWVLDQNDNTISYFFGGVERANKLGRVDEDQIISESTRPFGQMTVYYEKE